MIEQAVFGSAQTHRTEGYHLLRRTTGLADVDARDLVAWCPTHDSLLRSSLQATSVNFHRLASGAFCISRSRPAGSEYSCRGGQHVMTHCLIVPADILLRFSNNPFAVLRAATALGAVADHEGVPDRLDPINLRGRSTSVDCGLIESFRQSHSARLPLQLLNELTAAHRVGCVSGIAPEQLVAVLLNLLPVSVRAEISFATGLKFSPCRPFRLQILPNDRAEVRRFMRQANISVVDDGDAELGKALRGRWPHLIEELLQVGGLDWLADELGQARHANGTLAGLEDLATELQAKFHVWQSKKTSSCAETTASPGSPLLDPSRRPKTGQEIAEPRGAEGDVRRDDAAHRRRGKAASTATLSRPSANASGEKKTNPLDPKIMEVLNHLDEAVFAAIGGDAAALERLSVLWPLIQDELSDALLEESRENYLRHALASWSAQETGANRSPGRAATALDVLCLLFEH